MNLPCSIAKNIFVFLRHHPNYFQPPTADILNAFSEFPLQNHLDIYLELSVYISAISFLLDCFTYYNTEICRNYSLMYLFYKHKKIKTKNPLSRMIFFKKVCLRN